MSLLGYFTGNKKYSALLKKIVASVAVFCTQHVHAILLKHGDI